MLARSWERPKPDGMGRGPQDFYREQRRRRKKHRGGARGRIAPANFFFARYSAKRPEIREPKRPPPLPPHLRDGASQRAADQYGLMVAARRFVALTDAVLHGRGAPMPGDIHGRSRWGTLRAWLKALRDLKEML
jgi:hypothetical protein